ncbi:hypothetical protein [Thalassobaculum sp.]|uniref:hypothetical protein n=1 Tax=Thalassobaculum sp. TaxID=2022740 RepID=UPI0032EECED0
MRFAVVVLVVGTLISIAQGPAMASRLDEATVAVDATLDRLKVDRSRIRSIYLAPDDHPNDGPVPSYTGWIAFNDCRGNLVVDLSATASVRALYTTGACTVPGVD